MTANNYLKVARYTPGTDGLRDTVVTFALYPFNDRDPDACAYVLQAAQLCARNLGGAVVSVHRPIRDAEIHVIGYGGGFT
jgi:hypothetical protein